jgi:hypothetical protein
MSLTLQEQADACGAVLILQELIDARLVQIDGEIDASLCRAKLKYLKSRGFVPSLDEEKLVKLASLLAIQMGHRIR